MGVDARGNITGADGVPAALGPHQDSDVYVGLHRGRRIWVRAQESQQGFGWRDTTAEWEEPLAAALALANWHVHEPRCERCGEATIPTDDGVHRLCTACDHLQFARTDPAVIVAVLDPTDRLLLARQATWAPRRYSVLAGFVEPGESLEQACWREVEEEARVDLTAVRYVGSQPWPMPRSLMVGFVAATSDVDVEVDGVELVHGAFLTREQVRTQQDDGSLELPSSASLGRMLIEAWLAHDLPRP